MYVHNRGDGWRLYTNGYRLAADHLITEAESHMPALGQANALLYPIVFLYRQHLELMLKYIILVGRRLKHETTQPPRDHRLRVLWGKSKSVMREQSISVSSVDRDQVDKVINELDGLDPSSDLFRYPLNKTAKFPFPDDLRQFSLSLFGAKLRAASDVLRKIADLLDADLELGREFYYDLYGG